MQKYKKLFTRDHTFIQIEFWSWSHDQGIEVWFGGKRPYQPAIIFYNYKGAEETWHNINAYKWIKNTLQKEIKRNPHIVKQAINTYSKLLKPIKKLWQKPFIGTVGEFENFLKLVNEAAVYFPVWYYAAVDERTPKSIRNQAGAIRDQDSFYDSCDLLIRKTIRRHYPKLKNYEAVILRKEINKPPAINILKKRQENFVFIPGKTEEIISLNAFARKNKNVYKFIGLDEAIKFSGDTVRGQTACPGKVRGKVKIIRSLNQLGQVLKGDILVSAMTTPNFLPAMKKAAAFITDEGGITCHAAVVAREMKKPCVIGAKIATKVLHDGDEVEADANKGVVKIIKKAK